jgi:hypothetical protein
VAGNPEGEAGYLVFAQQEGADADVDAWNAHATRFFGTRLGLAEEPRRDEGGVNLRIVVAPDSAPPGIRSVRGRLRSGGDLAAAEAAEARSGGGGLSLLARRCNVVWLVVRDDEPDRTALLLAAILAGSLLGPILDSRSLDLFGVKTARARLAP